MKALVSKEAWSDMGRFFADIARRGWRNEYNRGWLIGGIASAPAAVVLYRADGWLGIVGFVVGWAIMFLLTMPALYMLLEAKGWIEGDAE